MATVAPPGESPGAFSRKATGLVREIGSIDSTVMNIIWVNLVLGVLVFTIAPYVYPGVNLALGWVITTVVLIIPILLYAWLAAAMPRSGGEYVYISRIINPALGFVANFGFTATCFIFGALLSAFVVTTGLTPMFATLGVLNHDHGLVTFSTDIGKPGWEFAIASAVLLISMLVNWFGLRPVMRTQRVFFAFSMLGLVVAGVLMAETGRSAFEHDFAKYGSYQTVLAAAGKGGFHLGAHDSLTGLIAFTALGFTTLALSQMPAYAAGELRRPRKNAVYSMLIALVFCGSLLAILAALAQRTFGLDFLGGMTSLSDAGSHAYPSVLPAPFFILYTCMLTHSSLLIVLMTGAIVVALVGNVIVTLFAASRNTLAWTLDGLLPNWVRQTNARHHAPTHAILFVHAVAFVILIPFCFGPKNLFNFVYSAATMQAIVFVVTAFAGAFFATRLSSVFNSSPHNRKIFHIPLMTVIGVCSIAIYAYFAYKLISDDRVGANSTSGLISIVTGFALAIVIYAVAWGMNKRRGVDIRANYKELPPE